jgi:hypothetical protein
MDIRLIPKDPPELQAKPKEDAKVQPTPEAITAAREILLRNNPIQAHVDYATQVRKVHGGEKGARVITMSAYSAFLPMDDRLHTDIVGSPQNGKSKVVTSVLETFPEGTCLALDQSFLNLPQNVFRPEKLDNMMIIHIH